ncbi:Aste57867_17372 [Aphanomyces stellatus]|uniref:Aste57867_17372 protein n=1 Tax=Aphanomyces stellatus TaxID=120398 RepID=A0A485L8D5_9STRA|nr:hypothetical protein As57867_017312 [Aphanomyces stellatus]VFT94128.1 Aste57867_17372 [Aphanomyces stellatus]
MTVRLLCHMPTATAPIDPIIHDNTKSSTPTPSPPCATTTPHDNQHSSSETTLSADNDKAFDAVLARLERLAPFACSKVDGTHACQCMVDCLQTLKRQERSLPPRHLKHLFVTFRRVRNTNNACAKVFATRGLGLLCEMAGGLQSLARIAASTSAA